MFVLKVHQLEKGTTVRAMLNAQRSNTTPTRSTTTTIRPPAPTQTQQTDSSKNKKVASGGFIDLTDDDDKSPPKSSGSVMRTVVAGSNIRPGTVLQLQGAQTAGGQVLLQPVTGAAGLRLAQQGNAVVYATNAGATLVRPVQTVAQTQQRQAGQILIQRPLTTSNTVNRPPPPLQLAPQVCMFGIA